MNTISTYGYRQKYFASTFAQALRNALVAEKVCMVDNSDSQLIKNPYGNQPAVTVQALTGTYSTAAWTLTDDNLQVTDEFIVAEHIYDFEDVLTQFDIFASRIDEMIFAVAYAVDKWVVNNLCEDGTGVYSTPAGGFSTPGNVVVILSNILSKVSGYKETYNGIYVIVEASDIAGIVQAQAGVGFSYADAALNNGFLTSMLGVDIYVVQTGTFVDATTSSVSGTKTWTNAGHRVGGVKNMTTYAAPRGVKYVEKPVSGKTGQEVEAHGYCGFKAWTPKATLTIDITIV